MCRITNLKTGFLRITPFYRHDGSAMQRLNNFIEAQQDRNSLMNRLYDAFHEKEKGIELEFRGFRITPLLWKMIKNASRDFVRAEDRDDDTFVFSSTGDSKTNAMIKQLNKIELKHIHV